MKCLFLFNISFILVINAVETNKSFPKNRQDGRSGAEEAADLPQVHLRGRGPRLAAGHVLRAADAPTLCSQWPRLNRGLRRKLLCLLQRLRKAKKEAPLMEKPQVVKMHLGDMLILPEMLGNMVGVYKSVTFNQVEIKPEMIGQYLGEFSITYMPVKHSSRCTGDPPSTSSPSSSLLTNVDTDFSKKK
uniref:40S ribosomal protein S15 n=1 Tax=Equus asinus TaxID=9793 RepID=A0A8C4LYP6_EQUAS